MKRKRSAGSPGRNLPDIDQDLQRAHAHWNAGQTDQTAMICQQMLAVLPRQPDALHLLGLTAHVHGNLDLAIAHLRRACEAPRAPALYFSNLAEMCRQRGLLAESERAARRATSIDDNLAGAWNNLGIVLQESGKLAESRACLQRVLRLEPANPYAHNNLGNTCRRLGLAAEAEQHWRRALELLPDYAEPYSNLANLLTDQGQYAHARIMARRAIELSPHLADAYVNLAAAESADHQYAEAERRLRVLLAFAPRDVGGLAALAVVLKLMDELPAALEAARHAVALAPHNAEAQNALGQVLQALGEDREAQTAFERAAGLPGTVREQALVNLASLHMEFGRREVAATGFAAVIAEYPRSASAWYNHSLLHRSMSGDSAIGAMQALLRQDPHPVQRECIMLHFGLGKALLDAGETDEAFHHLHQGNRLKRSSLSYDAEQTSSRMRDIATSFAEDVPAVTWESGVTPVFVLGMPRSGTSLVEQILASHPAVHGAGEMRVMQRLADGLGPSPATAPPERLVAAGKMYCAKVAALARGRSHVIDKMPANFLHVELIRRMLPGARIIHCRRDPVDTCLSCYTQLFTDAQPFTYDLAELGRFHSDYQLLMAHWRMLLPASAFLEVDYEAVVADVEAQARRMLDFMGLPWNEACMAFHRTERPVRTASVNQVRQPIYAGSVGRWRRYTSHLGPLLRELGVSDG